MEYAIHGGVGRRMHILKYLDSISDIIEGRDCIVCRDNDRRDVC
jgi:hypothetical protein